MAHRRKSLTQTPKEKADIEPETTEAITIPKDYNDHKRNRGEDTKALEDAVKEEPAISSIFDLYSVFVSLVIFVYCGIQSVVSLRLDVFA